MNYERSRGRRPRWFGLRLLRALTERGARARGTVRNPSQAADLEAVGATAVVVDLERERLNDAVAGMDAVVFAAAAGAGGGSRRKPTVDFAAAVGLIEAARASGVSRYLMLSAIGARDPYGGDPRMLTYYEAKPRADANLCDSGLWFTIIRPGPFSEEPGTGLVAVGAGLPRTTVAIDDVVTSLAEVLPIEVSAGRTLEVTQGALPVTAALSQALGLS